MNLSKTLSKLKCDIDSVQEWANCQYLEYFANYFKGEVELYDKLKSVNSIITDSELEWILTSLPLELFSVSENLSKLKTAQEVIKLHIKQAEQEYIQVTSDQSESLSKRKEDAAMLTAEDKLLVTVYNSIIERVEKEMSFSRELIMSAKKIWDARRASEAPIPSVDTSEESKLPEYKW